MMCFDDNNNNEQTKVDTGSHPGVLVAHLAIHDLGEVES